jgi:hypothetical protein
MAAAAVKAKYRRDHHPKAPRVTEGYEQADEGAQNLEIHYVQQKATTWHKDRS